MIELYENWLRGIKSVSPVKSLEDEYDFKMRLEFNVYVDRNEANRLIHTNQTESMYNYTITSVSVHDYEKHGYAKYSVVDIIGKMSTMNKTIREAGSKSIRTSLQNSLYKLISYQLGSNSKIIEFKLDSI